MFYTKDQVKQILGNAPAGSDPKQIIKALVDRGNILEGFNEPKEGILKSIAKAVVSPIAKFGVQAANVGESLYDIAKGDVAGANEAMNKTRVIPGLGSVSPYVKGSDTNVQALKGTIGGGLELGSLLVGGGGTAQVGKASVKGLVKEGIKQGAKFGMVSGLTSSAGQELQKKDSTVGSTILEGAKGAFTGGLVGGTIGGLTSGAGGIVKKVANSNKEKVSRDAYKVIAPELSKSEKIAAIEAGRGVQGPLGKTVIAPSKRDLQVAKAAEGIVSTKNSFVKNVVALKSAIKTEAQSTIKHLEQNDSIFNTAQFRKHISSIERPPLVVTDARLNSAYDLAQKKLLEFIAKQPKKLSGILKARKEFDIWIEKSFPKIFDNPNNAPLQTALRDMRIAANDFVAKKLPVGSVFKNSLKKQNLLYEAIGNIADKNYKIVGKSFLQRNPTIKKTLQYGATAALGGTAAKAFLD